MECLIYASNKPNKPFEFIESKIAPATTQTEWAGKWDKRVMYYDVIGTCRTMSKKQVRRALNYAMTTWDVEINVQFKPFWWGATREDENGDTIVITKPDITLDFKDKTNDKQFRDRPSVLAYAYFPDQGSVSGIIVFNNDYIWDYLGKGIKAGDALVKGWIDGTNNPNNVIKTYSIIAVLIHELGHSLGLRHDVTGNNDGIDAMDAFYSGANRLELSDRDIYRIHLKYNARIFSRWHHYGRLKKALARSKKRLIIR